MTRLSLLVFVALAFVACKKAGGSDLSKYPGTDDGARQLLNDIRTSADPRAMTRALQPTSADYKAVYTDDVAADMATGFEQHVWSDGRAVIAAKPENTELLIGKLSSEDIARWTTQAVLELPGGYKQVGPKLVPGLAVYYWKYVKPSAKAGMSFDGLIYVNGHWAWFPKPWRVLAATKPIEPATVAPGSAGSAGSAAPPPPG